MRSMFKKFCVDTTKDGKMLYILKMAMAVLGSFLVINVLCFFYFDLPRAVTNRDDFTTRKNIPNHKVCYCGEGFGISQTDKYGFYNDGNVTFDNANIVCIGSSQTEAIQVNEEEKYVSLLNGMDEHNHAYNLGVSGQYFEKYCGRLPIIPRFFPSAGLIIMETIHMPKEDDWDAIMDTLSTGNLAIEDHDWKEQNLLFRICRSIPYTALLKRQITGIMEALNDKKDAVPEKTNGMLQYTIKANNTMELLRQKMGNMPLIFLYVPYMDMDHKGQVSVAEDKAKIAAVEKACKSNSIIFVNMGPAFLEYYNKNHVLPHGHLNSQVGKGHLNKDGHRMIADTLAKRIHQEGLVP